MTKVETEQCVACGRLLAQLSGGHRKRRYCDATCRQRAHRARQAEQAKAEREGSRQSGQERIAQLEAENARLRQRLDVETRYRLDTRQHNFKPRLRKQRLYTPGSFAQRFVDDKAFPPQASRSHYEALLRSACYSDEDIETFRDLWKAMLLS